MPAPTWSRLTAGGSLCAVSALCRSRPAGAPSYLLWPECRSVALGEPGSVCCKLALHCATLAPAWWREPARGGLKAEPLSALHNFTSRAVRNNFQWSPPGRWAKCASHTEALGSHCSCGRGGRCPWASMRRRLRRLRAMTQPSCWCAPRMDGGTLTTRRWPPRQTYCPPSAAAKAIK